MAGLPMGFVLVDKRGPATSLQSSQSTAIDSGGHTSVKESVPLGLPGAFPPFARAQSDENTKSEDAFPFFPAVPYNKAVRKAEDEVAVSAFAANAVKKTQEEKALHPSLLVPC